MERKLWKYIEKHQMIKEGDRLIVGVSGGADSVALFHLLLKYRQHKNFWMYVVHVNHNLRGAEANRDANFVRELCEREKIPYGIYSEKVEEVALEKKIGLEEAGRMVRQRIFLEQKVQWNCTKIVLAHHGNDLAETMLHHLARGTGLPGLCGIAPVQGDKIRPLLCLERQEIEQYLKDNQYNYVTDSSNLQEDYTRNRIRKNVIPLMEEQMNPRVVPHMMETAEQLSRVHEYISKQSKNLLKEKSVQEENKVRLMPEFFCEDAILCEYALLSLVESFTGTRKDITAYHVRGIMDLAKKPVGKQVELPGEYSFVRDYNGILLEAKSIQETRQVETTEIHLGGTVTVAGKEFFARVFPYSGQLIEEKRYTKWLNYDKIDSVPQLRRRKPGDYLVVDCQGHHKKLKDYFIDCKIPTHERDDVLLLTLGSEVLWVVGYRISEAYKIDNCTDNVLEIIYKGEEENVR